MFTRLVQVITDVVLKAWPAFHAVNVVNATVAANSTSAFSEFMSVWLGMQEDLADAGMGGISELVRRMALPSYRCCVL
jgi:hypothetical protein